MAKLLWKPGLRGNTKGAIGIGTLIVFIALVLVAAIAASVIISTSFNLRDQAIATSEAARQEVTGPIKILNFYGDRVSTANAGLQWLVFHVTIFSGAQGINMSNMRLNYIDATTSFIYTMRPCATAGSAAVQGSSLYNATEVPAAAGNGWDTASNLCFLDSGNILEIWIPVTTANPSGLLPGTTTQIAFLPGSGPAVTKTFATPSSYDAKTIVPLL